MGTPNALLKRSFSTISDQISFRQPIRPFISSTFIDFEEERDHLVKRIFPQLNSLCHKRGTHFSPIDLRWGISDEQVHSGNVISLCLDYINSCSPFFICLLGERYGSNRPPESKLLEAGQTPDDSQNWMDKNYLVAAANGHSWILQEAYQCCSVTELEIIQAAYLNDSQYCRFYFRDVQHIQDKFTDLEGEELQQKLKVFACETKQAEIRVHDIKRRIINKALPVRFFRTVEELGEKILQDWTAIINQFYLPLHDAMTDVDGELYREWAAHEAYAETRRRIFIRNHHIDKLFETLDDHGLVVLRKAVRPSGKQNEGMAVAKMPNGQEPEERKSILTLVGERGCGKTAIVANWIKHFKKDYPGLKVLSHFIGSSALSADITSFLRRVSYELREEYTGGQSEESNVSEDMSNFHHICEAFIASLALGPCVLVLDGIDELSGTLGQNMHQIKEMSWLPVQLPSHCKIILTTVHSDLTFKTLSQRRDSQVFVVPLFSEQAHKSSMVTENLALHCKCLGQGQLEKVVTSKLSDRPLFLSILANELRVCGTYGNLDKVIDQYIEASTFRDLWKCVIHRWIRDYGWTTDGRTAKVPDNNSLEDTPSWVAEVLRHISCSRHGLTEPELLELLRMMGYTDQAEVTPFDFALFRSATFDALVDRPCGLMSFFHQHLREAVENSLLGIIGGTSDVATDASPQSANLPWGLNRRAKLCHELLGSYFWRQPHSLRRTLELPWQLDKCSNMAGLLSILTEPEVFLMMCQDGIQCVALKLDLLRYWHRLQVAGYDVSEAYDNMVANAIATSKEAENSGQEVGQNQMSAALDEKEDDLFYEYQPEDRCKVALLAMHAGKFLAERACFTKSESLLVLASEDLTKNFPLSTPEQLLLSKVQENLGDLHRFQLHNSLAKTFYNKACSTLDSIAANESDDIYMQLVESKGRILNHLGMMAVKDYTKEVKGAERILYRATDCMTTANSIAGLATAQFILGVVQIKKRDYESAEKCLCEALHSRERWHGASHPLVAEVLNELAGLIGDNRNTVRYDRIVAEACYRRALRIREQSYGRDHLLVATTLFHLGKLLMLGGSHQCKNEAMLLLGKAIDIRTTKLGPNHVLTKAIYRAHTMVQKQLQFGDYDYAPVKKSTPKPTSARNLRGVALIRTGKLPRAKSAAPRLRGNDPAAGENRNRSIQKDMKQHPDGSSNRSLKVRANSVPGNLPEDSQRLGGWTLVASTEPQKLERDSSRKEPKRKRQPRRNDSLRADGSRTPQRTNYAPLENRRPSRTQHSHPDRKIKEDDLQFVCSIPGSTASTGSMEQGAQGPSKSTTKRNNINGRIAHSTGDSTRAVKYGHGQSGCGHEAVGTHHHSNPNSRTHNARRPHSGSYYSLPLPTHRDNPAALEKQSSNSQTMQGPHSQIQAVRGERPRPRLVQPRANSVPGNLPEDSERSGGWTLVTSTEPQKLKRDSSRKEPKRNDSLRADGSRTPQRTNYAPLENRRPSRSQHSHPERKIKEDDLQSVCSIPRSTASTPSTGSIEQGPSKSTTQRDNTRHINDRIAHSTGDSTRAVNYGHGQSECGHEAVAAHHHSNPNSRTHSARRPHSASYYSLPRPTHRDIPAALENRSSNSQTMQGPHSQIQAVLGERPRPRPLQPRVLHTAAWYHEPGRYQRNSSDVYPPRRHQKRPTSSPVFASNNRFSVLEKLDGGN